ncbi:hypothetical protein C1X21_14305 [Pseudomonas sp. FW305-3-2-15-A-LB2]|nr:hypothetical protein C1X17_24535 [Pseudomonas sp. FW305-3-2-15-C-TSA2]PMV26870.1 hypothetical protein C1X22_17730 [Pseudomonas sp. DP16D-L5]PMV38538.1 hypothetical protein C1X21_14305 [Pseudomonas sp. FW305-3-2-15-A-LB2]PMV43748.1 hypothetical protein C1X16_18900 [Pseudomonas sp. FW305-3-2-15-C-R2A1]PMV50148.1 hypothetical protein C1X18_17000 [Pseudomonas sp. FW305-3-2-15-C-LB1]PMV56200.1 hypothetical protein C1X19_14350 [Pseudomonas sp. GW460-4]PMV61799.1 hypothetical protein C1X20_17060 
MMNKYLISFVSCLLVGAFGLSVNAAGYIDLGHATGEQCKTESVTNNGIAVGNCSPASTSANNVPFVANVNTPNSQARLEPLDPHQPCVARAISNDGWIGGSCNDANSVDQAVIWNAATPGAAPTVLTPLPSTLLRAADVRTMITAFNQRGDMIGWSISNNDERSTVVWLAGTGTPVRVFSSLLGLLGYNDKCIPTDVNTTLANGYPSIALNCPGANGITVPRIAQRNASAYAVTSLPIASGANRCTVSGINNLMQSVGDCEYPQADINLNRTAVWNTPTATPQTLTLAVDSKNAGLAINNTGVVLAARQDATGRASYLTWLPTLGVFGIQLIVPPTGAVWVQAFSIADNGIVALNSTDSDQYNTGCIWTPATSGSPATNNCLASIGGGKKNQLTTLSQNGGYAGGVNVNGAQDLDAVATPLP